MGYFGHSNGALTAKEMRLTSRYAQALSDKRVLFLQDSRPWNVAAHKSPALLRSNPVHVGRTGRLLGTRLKKHQGLVRRHDANLCPAPNYMDTGHTFNWQDTHILRYANSQRAREVIDGLPSGGRSIKQFMLQANTFTALIGMPPHLN